MMQQQINAQLQQQVASLHQQVAKLQQQVAGLQQHVLDKALEAREEEENEAMMRALVVVNNAQHVPPAWFPANLHELSCATAAQEIDLMNHYKLVVKVNGTKSQRQRAIRMHLGIVIQFADHLMVD